jgi:hypothetical protein
MLIHSNRESVLIGWKHSLLRVRASCDEIIRGSDRECLGLARVFKAFEGF